MHKLLIALMLVSGGALADPPRYTTEQNQYGRTVAGSSCAGGYCAQYDRTGRTVGNSSYTQDRAPEVNQQPPSFPQFREEPRASSTGEGLFLFAN